jgi:hypothetical protein
MSTVFFIVLPFDCLDAGLSSAAILILKVYHKMAQFTS